MSEWRELIEHFVEVFEATAASRSKFQERITHPLYPKQTCTQWHVHEVNAMTAEINRLRLKQGKEAIPLEAVYRVETQACGHVDYARKFALYCAELVNDVPGRFF